MVNTVKISNSDCIQFMIKAKIYILLFKVLDLIDVEICWTNFFLLSSLRSFSVNLSPGERFPTSERFRLPWIRG